MMTSPYTDEEIPCIDCLILPICKSKITPLNKVTYLSAVRLLADNCSLMLKYITVYSDNDNMPIIEKISAHRCRLAILYISDGEI